MEKERFNEVIKTSIKIIAGIIGIVGIFYGVDIVNQIPVATEVLGGTWSWVVGAVLGYHVFSTLAVWVMLPVTLVVVAIIGIANTIAGE